MAKAERESTNFLGFLAINMKNKKLLLATLPFFLTVVLLGASRKANAGFFSDIFNFFKPQEKSSSVSSSTTPTKNNESLYKPVVEYEDAVTKSVSSAEPSVVSIIIKKDLPVIENCPYSPFDDLPPEFRDFFGNGFGSQFYRQCQKGTEKKEVGGGSGFIISADGLIITNKHVVSDTEAEYTVLTNDGKKHDAKILARDPSEDIAIIKINISGLRPAKIGNSDSLKLGQTAIAIGNALGEFRNTVSVGVISGLARTVTAGGGNFTETLEGVIQTDAAINQGNSGGPLLNLKGEVIGVNTAIAAGAQNIGFAIPINQAKRDIESVKKTGDIKFPYLGVRFVSITPEIAKKQNLEVEYGALVRGSDDGPGIIQDSPAAKAGLKAEDIILEVGGVKLKDVLLSAIIQKYNVGDSVLLKIIRDKKNINITVRLGERPNF